MNNFRNEIEKISREKEIVKIKAIIKKAKEKCSESKIKKHIWDAANNGKRVCSFSIPLGEWCNTLHRAAVEEYFTKTIPNFEIHSNADNKNITITVRW